MAIRFEDMPEANRQRALEIFGQQLRGEISQTMAEQLARQNEESAQRALSGTTATGPGQNRPGGTANKDAAPAPLTDEDFCGIKPPGVGPNGGAWYCDRDAREWKESTRFGVAPITSTTDPMRDPSRKPAGAPVGFDYVWNGTMWELKEVAAQGPTQGQRESAKAIINAVLADYGLEGLGQFVHDMVFKEDVMNAQEILARIRADQGEAGKIYQRRFAGNYQRRTAGLNVLSEPEYIALETSFSRAMRAAGLPSGFYDSPDDFAALIGGDVSLAELNTRINEGYLAVQQANPQVINEMRRLYGVDDSMLAAYFLDPAKATPMLLRQARAAQIASEATLQAEQQIGAMTAEELAVAGITQQQARAGFQTIAQAEELFVPLPGTTEQAITQEEQIAGVFGTSAAAQQRIRQRSRERQAAFQAGGTFAGQGTTVTGLQ
jgi:hypothetical protein